MIEQRERATTTDRMTGKVPQEALETAEVNAILGHLKLAVALNPLSHTSAS